MIAYAGPAAEYAQLFLDKLLAAILFPLITLLLVVALVVFLYGCFEYVVGSNNETARSTGKKHILWGLIGLLVMLSALALLEIAASTFGIETPTPGAVFTPSGSEVIGEVRVPGGSTR